MTTDLLYGLGKAIRYTGAFEFGEQETALHAEFELLGAGAGDKFVAQIKNQVAEEAMEHLQRHGVAAGVVQNPRDILESDHQVQARDLFPVMHHPVIGDCIHPTSGAQLSRTPSRIETSPLLGEHNEKVFCQFLGMSSEEFASLVSEQVIY